jgi:hypothetical protein
VIDEGTYAARALRAALGMTSTGKEQVAVEWGLLDGSGRKITSYHYFSSDKAIEISMDGLRTAGFQGNDLSDLSTLCHSEGCPTPECEIVIVHEEYNGKTSAKVRFINSAGGLALSAPLDDAKAKAFAARMRGAIAAYEQSAGSNPPRRAATKPRPQDDGGFQATDDDVPF